MKSWAAGNIDLNVWTLYAIAGLYTVWSLKLIVQCQTSGIFVVFLYSSAVTDLVVSYLDAHWVDMELTLYGVVILCSALCCITAFYIFPVWKSRIVSLGCARIVCSILLADTDIADYVNLRHVGFFDTYEKRNGDLFNIYFNSMVTLLLGSLIYQSGSVRSRVFHVTIYASYFLTAAAILFGAIVDETTGNYYNVITDAIHLQPSLLHKLDERYFLAVMVSWIIMLLFLVWRVYSRMARKRKEFYDVLARRARKNEKGLQRKMSDLMKGKLNLHVPTAMQGTVDTFSRARRAHKKNKQKEFDEVFMSLDKESRKYDDFNRRTTEMLENTKDLLLEKQYIDETPSRRRTIPAQRKTLKLRMSQEGTVMQDEEEFSLMHAHLAKFAKYKKSGTIQFDEDKLDWLEAVDPVSESDVMDMGSPTSCEANVAACLAEMRLDAMEQGTAVLNSPGAKHPIEPLSVVVEPDSGAQSSTAHFAHAEELLSVVEPDSGAQSSTAPFANYIK